MAAKLLIDENLAPRLVQDVSDLFPNSQHVADAGLLRAEVVALLQGRHQVIDDFVADPNAALLVLRGGL